NRRGVAGFSIVKNEGRDRAREPALPVQFEELPRSARMDDGAVRAPDIDAGKEEEPHHVDEVPVPGGSLEAEMMLRRELPGKRAAEADREEDGADEHMEAVEAGRHVEGRAIDVAREGELRMVVLIGLK